MRTEALRPVGIGWPDPAHRQKRRPKPIQAEWRRGKTGPRLEDLDEIDSLVALLRGTGPRPPPAARTVILEQAEGAMRVSERIRGLVVTAATEGAKLGSREVAKDLTAPLWHTDLPISATQSSRGSAL